MIPLLQTRILERLAQGSLELPLLPRAAQLAMQAASDEKMDARAVADIVERDQSMAAHLLRLSNSPIYASPVPIVSIRQAITRLGASVVGQIAVAVAMKTRAFLVPGWEAEASDLFVHAVSTGLFAKEISRLKRWNVEQAFLAGLMHDLGRPILIQALVDAARELELDPPRELLSQIIFDLHTRVGKEVVAAWSLPEPVVEAIAGHHDPAATSPMTLVVQLADVLSEPDSDDALVMSASERLHLYPEQLDALRDRRDAILAGARALA